MAANNGIPTAEQEALQAPTIDPIWFGALATTMGPWIALKSLAGSALFSELGGKHPQLGGLPAPPIGALMTPLLMGRLAKMLEPFGVSAAEAIKDSPDFMAMLGGKIGGVAGDAEKVLDPLETQTMDMFHRLLRPMPQLYPGAQVAQPLGIAALIDQMRGQHGGK